MIRGTTPTHVFKVDTDLRTASKIFITYAQNDEVIVEKNISDITIEEEQISTTLTQSETLAFSSQDFQPVEIQIRAGFGDGSSIASDIITTTVGKILKDEEI